MMMRIKAQYDESKEKVQYFTDQHSKLSDQIKILEDKQAQSRFLQNSLKSQIREKDSTISSLEEKLKNNDSFPNEKEKMEKSISNLNKNLQNTKEENEKKTRRLKELEKQNSEFKEKIDALNNENKKLNANSGSGVQTLHKEKDKKIKKLEDDLAPIKEENKKLKEELEKLKSENLKSSTEIEKKSDEIYHLQYENKNLQGKKNLLKK
jgi:chromosome segregation protein